MNDAIFFIGNALSAMNKVFASMSNANSKRHNALYFIPRDDSFMTIRLTKMTIAKGSVSNRIAAMKNVISDL